MAWISISLDTLKAYLNGLQLGAINTAVLDEGQVDRFTEVQPGVIARVRAEIGTNPKNVLDPDATKIPDSLKGEACALIIESMQPAVIPLAEDQKSAANNARKYLERIARGEVVVPDVTTAGKMQGGAGVKLVRPGNRVPRMGLLG